MTRHHPRDDRTETKLSRRAVPSTAAAPAAGHRSVQEELVEGQHVWT
jgi:hypothetical protein